MLKPRVHPQRECGRTGVYILAVSEGFQLFNFVGLLSVDYSNVWLCMCALLLCMTICGLLQSEFFVDYSVYNLVWIIAFSDAVWIILLCDSVWSISLPDFLWLIALCDTMWTVALYGSLCVSFCCITL